MKSFFESFASVFWFLAENHKGYRAVYRKDLFGQTEELLTGVSMLQITEELAQKPLFNCFLINMALVAEPNRIRSFKMCAGVAGL